LTSKLFKLHFFFEIYFLRYKQLISSKKVTLYSSSNVFVSFNSLSLYVKSVHLYFLHCFLLEQSFFKYGISCFPKKYKTFTVLRSPHTDKKSREQFHLIEYKYNMSIPIYLCVDNCISIFKKSSSMGLKIYSDRTLFIE
jgi:hypothetical protein